tara:strand:+ start:116 stop:505 length:390 start_codon:yes stop_codon:yes gene_type:complete
MSQKEFSGNLYYLNPASTASVATLTGGKYFHTFVNGSTAVNVTIQGGGLFEFAAVDDLSATNVKKYINPTTGVAFTGADDADGVADDFFERVGTEDISISLGPNQIVYGWFTKIGVAGSSNAEIQAYTG